MSANQYDRRTRDGDRRERTDRSETPPCYRHRGSGLGLRGGAGDRPFVIASDVECAIMREQLCSEPLPPLRALAGKQRVHVTRELERREREATLARDALEIRLQLLRGSVPVVAL